MHHVAIMKKSWGLIPKILSGEKTIESRWYKTRRAPWGKVHRGDIIFFKNSGEPVAARAEARRVMQFEIDGLRDAGRIIKKYGKRICFIDKNPKHWVGLPTYCILIFLENPKTIKPIQIDKTGFGSATAWLTVGNIRDITRLDSRSNLE